MASQASQAGSQVGTHLPSGEGSNLVASQATQAGRRAIAHLSSGEGRSLVATTQAVSTFLVTALPKQAVRPPQIPLLGKAFPSR